MARKKSKRRRAKKYFSIWNAGVAYGNLSILTRGTLGGVGPIEFFTGLTDLTSTTKSVYMGAELGNVMQTSITGGTELSLGDVLTEPSTSWDIIQANVKVNAVGMATEAIIFNTSATVLRRLLRAPINSANRLIRPLGLGVKI